MKIIPAIDIIDGNCVRLTKGDYSTERIYSNSPVELAKQFEGIGLTHLHVVDLDGAKTHSSKNLKSLEAIASQTNLKIDFGGGIKSTQAVINAFNAGAEAITAGSIAVINPLLLTDWLFKYGPEKIYLGADFLNDHVAINGWKETSAINVLHLLANSKMQGVTTAICTDISKDGMLRGPSFDMYRKIIKQTQLNLIASGGVSTVSDLKKLKELGCYGAIVGKAFYEGKITLKELASLC